jgi:argininosuccinate synthase
MIGASVIVAAAVRVAVRDDLTIAASSCSAVAEDQVRFEDRWMVASLCDE